MNTPAMIIDFEATDVSKEAEATQLGWRNVSFNDQGDLVAEVIYYRDDNQQSNVRFCKPDRVISYGAMALFI